MKLRKRVLIAHLSIFVSMAATLGGCVTNATTGRSQLSLMSHAQEIALGAEASPQFIQENGGEVSDTQLKSYVTEVGMKLKGQVETDEQKNLPWTFTLLNSPEINAFALPGGKVNISLALAKKMTNEAQMAGVLGHEIGHVTARHANDRMTQSTVAGVISSVVTSVVKDPAAGQLVTIGGQTILLKFSRSEESEADALGMRYMTRAGYNPLAMRQVMQILLEASKGGGKQPEILSTHPYPETRIKDIDAALKGEYANTQNNPQYVLNEDRYKQMFLNRAQSVQPMDPKTLEQKRQQLQQQQQKLQQQQLQQKKRSGMAMPVDSAEQVALGGDSEGRVFDLSRPATWCRHCAAAEQARLATK